MQHKEEQRRAAAGVLSLLIVAQALLLLLYSTSAGDQKLSKTESSRRAALAFELKLSTEEKEIKNRVMHVLQYIWKHLSNQDAF